MVWGLVLAQVASPVADAGAEYLRAGLLGAAVVTLAIVVAYLYRELAQIQQARVADAKDVTAQLLKVNESCVATMSKLDSALEAQRESTTELKSALTDLAKEIRDRPGALKR